MECIAVTVFGSIICERQLLLEAIKGALLVVIEF